MKTSSAKAKGRRLQKAVAERLRTWFGFSEADCHSTPMGTQGLDVKLASSAREQFPFAIECKMVEKINIWESWKQTKVNAMSERLAPLLVFSKNREEVLVVMRFDDLLHYSNDTLNLSLNEQNKTKDQEVL